MNVFDKFLNAIRLNDDFDEDDEYFEDEPVEETPKKTDKSPPVGFFIPTGIPAPLATRRCS